MQSSFLKSAEPGRIPGLSHLLPFFCQGQQGLVQPLRSALCLQYREGRKRRQAPWSSLFFPRNNRRHEEKNLSFVLLHATVLKKKKRERERDAPAQKQKQTNKNPNQNKLKKKSKHWLVFNYRDTALCKAAL